MKRHCVKAHDRSIGGRRVACDWCGETKRVNATQARELDHHFCDRECNGKWRSENFVGEDHPKYQGGKIEVECSVCSETKEVYPAWNRKVDRHFCSKECEIKWKKENQAAENHPNWIDSEIPCDQCGEMLHRTPYYLENFDYFFCNIECRTKWRQENWTGEDNPKWEGGYEGYYGPSWVHQRRKALERDGYKCKACGLSEEEQRKKFDRGLHVHHIKPFREFNDHKKANKLDNLITLCQECHYKWEGIPLKPQVVSIDHEPSTTRSSSAP